MLIKPADWVIRVMGGVRPAARMLGISPMAVSYWRTRSKGRIPAKDQQKILKVSRIKNLDIQPADLVIGRNISQNKGIINGVFNVL